ncbi:hypothetical protein [Natronolimnobius baerhuensis]|uniref:Uncharacterized protein n=1 Tax=Natronolimnobius baerhuensis TaxID=253108 RepID=A0A202EDP4_9EURY|nr:hypothetical protein [Natronolimnobius baerhuensis]OVE86308.1 hypothetical protein B2G88_05880 [Natronolimnobius baerhuensis]
MPSSTPSRRRLLAAASGSLSISLAGCVGDTGSFFEQNASDNATSTTTHEHDATETPTRDSSHRYDTLQVRTDGNDHVVYPDAETAADAAEGDDEYIHRPHRALFVTDTEDVDALEIDADDATAREIREFAADTNFEQQSIVIDQRTIDDCYERHLLAVTARGNSFRTEYCQRLKSPETACESDLERMEAVVIRVDRPYNEGPTSRSSGESMSCHGEGVVADRRTTEEDNE